MGLSTSHHSLDNIEFDNKEDDQHDQRLLSQFGIWFLVCKRRVLLCLSIEGSWEIRMCAEHGLLSLFVESMAAWLIRLLVSAGESLHSQREHADRDPGPTGQHGLPVVSLHCLHDGRWGWKSGGEAKTAVCHQMAKNRVWSTVWCHGYVSVAQTSWVCKGKIKSKCKGLWASQLLIAYTKVHSHHSPGGRILGQVLYHSDPTEGGPEPDPLSDTL